MPELTIEATFDLQERAKMSLSISGDISDDHRLPYPFRSIFSGSSQSGKTFIAGLLCENFHLFEKTPKQIVYYYPRFLKEKPIAWDQSDKLKIPIHFGLGLPNQDDIDDLDDHTLIVLDDLYDKAVNSEAIDHLFRVTSGKRNLSVMIMTQNSYSQGRYARDIRNSCNMQVLLRNCLDTTINLRVCRSVGLTEAYKSAEEDSKYDKYPYFLINLSPKAHRSNYRMFTDLLSKFPICWSVSGMKCYIISENDFRRFFEVHEKYTTKLPTFTATIKNETQIKKGLKKEEKKVEQETVKSIPRKRKFSSSDSSSSESESTSNSESSTDEEIQHQKRKSKKSVWRK